MSALFLFGILILLSLLANLGGLRLPTIRDIRAKRRRQMEELDRRKPKDWERLVE